MFFLGALNLALQEPPWPWSARPFLNGTLCRIAANQLRFLQSVRHVT